jgi:hypothetical protein
VAHIVSSFIQCGALKLVFELARYMLGNNC